MNAGKLADPVFRRDRARKARAAQATPAYHLTKLADNDPEFVALSARSLADDPETLARVRALLPVLVEAVS